jgi:hypothetical protein
MYMMEGLKKNSNNILGGYDHIFWEDKASH